MRPAADTPNVNSAPQWLWGNVVVLVLVHLLAVASVWTWSLPGFVLFLVMVYAKGCLGIAAGFHRLLSHKAYQTPRWVMYALAFLGCMALQGGPMQWASLHRLHHQESDQFKDPHSPVQNGLFWGHLGWTTQRYRYLSNYQIARYYAKDIQHDKVLKWMNRNGLTIFGLGHGVPLLLLGLWGGPGLALSALTWGCALSAVYVWHGTGLVNSVCHRWGYRNVATSDNSRNVWWVAALTFGEGWHNNHHAFQGLAKIQIRWFEWDPTYWSIRLLGVLGLAQNIRAAQPGHSRTSS